MSLIKLSFARKNVLKQRVWKVPVSGAAWKWLLACIFLYGVILVWYLVASHTQPSVGPFTQPFRSFGIVAFVLVFITATYSLRRRFVRGLPGKTRDWLWMHTWLGITALLIVFFHENFARIFNNYCSNLSCLTQSAGGTSALYALLFLVAGGIVGRIVDVTQTRIIVQEANSNGVGIVRAVEERLLELEYTIERFCAGKSEEFQRFARLALAQHGQVPMGMDRQVPMGEDGQGQALSPRDRPPYLPGEQHDFEQMIATLATYAQLAHSLRRQEQARRIMRIWRITHAFMACLALAIILLHATLELVNTF
jgi:hypothetical protein